VHRRTPCAFAPQTPARVARTSVGATFGATRGLGPCPRHRIATRARICSTDFYPYVCGGLEDGAKAARYSDERYLSPPHRVAELVRKASTHRYLSFDPVTEHTASEMHLLRCDKGKAEVLYRACLDLPSCLPPARPPADLPSCLPPARPPAHSRTAWHGLASTAADPEARRSPACVLSADPTHRLPFRRRMG
jgi:hypothetical protein